VGAGPGDIMRHLSRSIAAIAITAVLAGMITPQTASASAIPEAQDAAPINDLPESVHVAPDTRPEPEEPTPQEAPEGSPLAVRNEAIKELAAAELADVAAHESRLVVEPGETETIVADVAVEPGVPVEGDGFAPSSRAIRPSSRSTECHRSTRTGTATRAL
jgi:hypothetical protein